MRLPAFGAALALVLTCQLASAHKPFFSDGLYNNAETAWPIDDIAISIVMYHEVTCDTQALWMKFDNEPGDLIYHQIGVPMIDRLESYRPVVAVVAPGLPEIDLPFEVPEGMGAQMLNTYWVDEPEEFLEPFTSTRSWILNDSLLELPTGEGGYVVSWHPEGMTGKFWVAVGTIEDFTSEDIARVTALGRKLEDFHEQRNHSPRPEFMQCEEPLGASGGCTTVTPWWPLLALVFFIRRKVRQA